MKFLFLSIAVIINGCTINPIDLQLNQPIDSDASTFFELGLKASLGEDQPQDLLVAFNWYEKAALKGHALAQYHVSYMLMMGIGAEKNLEKAFNWASKSADQGLSEAQFNLGMMYKRGEGVLENIGEAFNWTLKAAEQGHSNAQFNLGVWYGTGGGGVEKDQVLAFKWYLAAAKQGNENAQIIVGGRYHAGGIGGGVTEDRVRGQAWLLQGASRLAQQYQKRFAARLTDAELEKAVALALVCKESSYQNCD